MFNLPENRLKAAAFLDRVVYISVLVLLASFTFSTALMEIASVTAIIAWILLKFFKSEPFPFERKSFTALSAFVLLSVASFFWSEFPKQSFRGIFKILQQFLVFWTVAETLRTPGRQTLAFRVLLFSFIYLGLDGMWQFVFGRDLLRGIPFEKSIAGGPSITVSFPRISASFKNYGLLAAFVLCYLPLLMVQCRKRGNFWSQVGLSFAIVFGCLLLFWTRLRGAWIAFLAGIFFYLWFTKKRIYVFGFLLLAALGIFLLPRSMVIHLDAEGKEQSLVERFYLWDRAVQVIQARPFTGTGINTYAVAHEKFDRRQNWRVRGYYAHNGYLQMAAETGLPSLACFMAFLFFYFWVGLQKLRLLAEGIEKRISVAFLAGMANFLILGTIDTMFHNTVSILGFWFLAGWGAAYQNVFKERLSAAKN